MVCCIIVHIICTHYSQCLLHIVYTIYTIMQPITKYFTMYY
jgi:hypothetical protein